MRMKFGDYRQFELDRTSWADGPAEDPFVSRNELRAIISRMRGEIPKRCERFAAGMSRHRRLAARARIEGAPFALAGLARAP